jgi:hypothetical protein
MQVDRARVEKLIKRWRQILDIGDKWTIDVAINHHSQDEILPDCQDAAARIITDSGYSHAHLTINAFNIDTWAELVESVIHELCHVVLDPMSVIVRTALKDQPELATDIVEAVTCQFGWAFLRSLKQ